MNRSRVLGIVVLVLGFVLTSVLLPIQPWLALLVVFATFVLMVGLFHWSEQAPAASEFGSDSDPAESERRLRTALIQAERSVGSDHLSLCGPLTELSTLLQAQSRFDEAENCLQRAIELVDARREAGDRANTLRIRLGELHLESGRFDAAEAAFRAGFADPSDFPPDHRIARRFAVAGAVRVGRNLPRQALALQRRAAELFEIAGHARPIESVETCLECAALTLELEPGSDVKPWTDTVRRLTADQPRLRRMEMAVRLEITLRQSFAAGRTSNVALVSQTLTELRTGTETDSNPRRGPLETLVDEACTAEAAGDAARTTELLTRAVSTFDADPGSHGNERNFLIEALAALCRQCPDDPVRLVALSDRIVAELRAMEGAEYDQFEFLVSSATVRSNARDSAGARQRLDEADALLEHCDSPDGLARYFSLRQEQFREADDWDGLDRFFRSRFERLEVYESSPEFLFGPMLQWIEMLTDRMRLDDAGCRLIEAEAMCAAPHAPRDAYIRESAVCARFLRISAKLDEAEREGEAALGLAENLLECGKALHATVLVGLAETKRRLGKRDEAAGLLERARAIHDASTVRLVLAQVRCDQGRIAEAEVLSLAGIELAQKEGTVDGTALHTRGVVLAAQGRLDEALESLTRAAELDARRLAGDHPEALETAAALESVRRRLASSESQVTSATGHEPTG